MRCQSRWMANSESSVSQSHRPARASHRKSPSDRLVDINEMAQPRWCIQLPCPQIDHSPLRPGSPAYAAPQERQGGYRNLTSHAQQRPRQSLPSVGGTYRFPISWHVATENKEILANQSHLDLIETLDYCNASHGVEPMVRALVWPQLLRWPVPTCVSLMGFFTPDGLEYAARSSAACSFFKDCQRSASFPSSSSTKAEVPSSQRR